MKNLQPILSDPASRREQIRAKTLAGIQSSFPVEANNTILEVRDVQIKDKDYSLNQVKKALLKGSTLNERVVGTLVLKDKKTGKVLEEKPNHTLAQVPYLTQNSTFVVGGNEYSIPNQLRLKPGVYTRQRNNGEYEAAFNLKRGSNFRISMAEDTGKMHMELGSSKIPLYPVLKELGVTDKQIEDVWGAEVRKINTNLTPRQEAQALSKVYKKIRRKTDPANPPRAEMRDKVKEYFSSWTQMDPEVTRKTLGKAAGAADPDTMLKASSKLLRVHRGEEATDDRDSLEFKTIHSVDDFFKERLEKEGGRAVQSKLKGRLNRSRGKTLEQLVPNGTFTKPLNTFITNSNLSAIPMQINPVELIDSSARITSLGEGGIGSTRAVPMDSRKVHNTHLGIIDPVRTPESFSAGIDIRASLAGYRDDDGNLYSMMKNRRTGKVEPVSVNTLAQSKIAFANQGNKKKLDVMYGDKITFADRDDVDYEVPDATATFSPATAMVPLIGGMQGNRAIMGGKFQAQAVPLSEREAPLVQAGGVGGKKSMEEMLADLINPTSAYDGVVDKIDNDYIYIRRNGTKKASDEKTAADDLVKVPYSTYFPYAAKTFRHDEIGVKPGDKVKAGQQLAQSNYTKDGKMAIGKNMSVGYMAYYGKNSNDAVVISSTAAKKLTSEHMYKKSMPKDKETVLDKKKFQAHFGMKYTKAQLDKLDANGIAKEGVKIEYGDPIILALRKNNPTSEQKMLGDFSKSLVKPYVDASLVWEKVTPCTVTDVADTAMQVMVTVRTAEPMKVGDKLSNRYGGKGVVSEIVDDNRMVKDETDAPIDILFTSASVVSRVNPAQIVEASLGKVAHKTGKPIVLPQFDKKNLVKFAKDELQKNGLKDKETVYDPISDKKINNVFVGRSYIHKLFKNTESNYSARGVTSYDINEQPTKGGETGAGSLGKHEINALLAHGARNTVKDAVTIKSEKSDEFWRSYELGLPLPNRKQPFASKKFESMMRGAGINVTRKGQIASLAPLTDRDVEKLSSGQVKLPRLDQSRSMLVNASNMQPERGGLFDPLATGGMNGEKWSHMDLPEPVMNPVFEEPVRRLLGVTKKQLAEDLNNQGGDEIRKRLNSIDLNEREKELRRKIKTAKGSTLNGYVKQLKYIQALKKNNMSPGDAYTMKKLPVIPPKMRPIVMASTGNSIQVSDSNYLYRDVGLAASALASTKTIGIDSMNAEARKTLQESVSALYGTSRSTTPQLAGRETKGLMEQLTGTSSPKTGYIQKKLIKRKQDLSGRATIAPDVTLGMDSVGIPEDMLWTTYEKFIIKGLVAQGYTPSDAAENVEKRTPVAKAILDKERKQRPVFINRAPTLHRFGFMAAYPEPRKGKTIAFPSWLEDAFNADFDGDAVQVHVPVTDKAVGEAQNLTMSKVLFSDKNREDLLALPKHEAMMGIFQATAGKKNQAPVKFKSQAEAMKAYREGEISMDTPVEISK